MTFPLQLVLEQQLSSPVATRALTTLLNDYVNYHLTFVVLGGLFSLIPGVLGWRG